MLFLTKVMRLLRQILDNLTRNRRAAPAVRLKIRNLTRQTVLADKVEVADQGATRRKGLLGRDCLAEDEGLWILPCESVHTFGMKFSIDLIYLDREKRVRKTRSGVPPWRLSACLSAHSVIELAPGAIRRSETRPGDRLEMLPKADE